MAIIDSVPLAVREESLCAAAGVTYTFNDYAGLTFSEILLAVTLERSVVLEEMSVNTLNTLEAKTLRLEVYATAMEMVLDGALPTDFVPLPDGASEIGIEQTPTLYEVITEVMQITTTAEDWSYSERMRLYNEMKTVAEPLNVASQEDVIDLQTWINARDTVFEFASYAVRSIGKTALNTSNAYL